MFLSVVIPAYNEQRRIKKTVDTIEEYLMSMRVGFEIVIIVEESQDDTEHVCDKLAREYGNIRILANNGRMGKGYSVRRGILNSFGDIIMFTDADLSTPIYELVRFIPVLESGADACIAQRIQKRRQPIIRILSGLVFRYMVRLINKLPFRDTQCGFKVFTREFAMDVFSRCTVNGFAFDVEMLMIAKMLDYKVEAVDVEWYNDKHSTVSLFRDSIKMFADIVSISSLLRGGVPKGEHVGI